MAGSGKLARVWPFSTLPVWRSNGLVGRGFDVEVDAESGVSDNLSQNIFVRLKMPQARKSWGILVSIDKKQNQCEWICP